MPILKELLIWALLENAVNDEGLCGSALICPMILRSPVGNGNGIRDNPYLIFWSSAC